MADRVDGLLIKGNTITHQPTQKSLYPNAPLFDFTHCKNVKVIDNIYIGKHQNIYKTDKSSRPNIIIKNNQGFSNNLNAKQK